MCSIYQKKKAEEKFGSFLLKPIEAGKRRHRIKEKLHENLVSMARRSRRRRMKPFEGRSLTICHSLALHMEHLSRHLFDIDGARGSCRLRFFSSLSLSSAASHKTLAGVTMQLRSCKFSTRKKAIFECAPRCDAPFAVHTTSIRFYCLRTNRISLRVVAGRS